MEIRFPVMKSCHSYRVTESFRETLSRGLPEHKSSILRQGATPDLSSNSIPRKDIELPTYSCLCLCYNSPNMSSSRYSYRGGSPWLRSRSIIYLPKLQQLPGSLPLDGAVRLELQEGVPVLRASTTVQRRVKALVRKQQEKSLTPEEMDELDRYEEIDDYLSFVNRTVRNQFLAQQV